MRHLLFLLLPLAFAASAKDEVYKWVDKDGNVHYTDKPPTADAKPAELPKLHIYRGDQVPALDAYAPEPQKAGAPPAVRIVAPAADETFRGTQDSVSVSVMVTPGLGPGHKLLYHLDGAPQGGPTQSLSATLTGAYRGSHSIFVALMDENGREIGRSPPVRVHMKPPIARN